jgi:hypothetical protein
LEKYGCEYPQQNKEIKEREVKKVVLKILVMNIHNKIKK